MASSAEVRFALNVLVGGIGTLVLGGGDAPANILAAIGAFFNFAVALAILILRHNKMCVTRKTIHLTVVYYSGSS